MALVSKKKEKKKKSEVDRRKMQETEYNGDIQRNGGKVTKQSFQ